MRLITRENRGLIESRNELLSAARGEYIAWLDSDDEALPYRLQIQVDALDQDPNRVCVGGNVQLTDPEGMPISMQRFPQELDPRQHLQSPVTEVSFGASMMRTAAVRAVGGFRHPFDIGEDFDLLVRLIEIGKISNVPHVVLKYRQHLQSVSSSQRLGTQWSAYCDLILSLARERRETGKDRLQRGEFVAVDRRIIDPAEPETPWVTHARWARTALANGFRRTAFKHALAAVRCRPMSPASWRVVAGIVLGSVARG